MRNKIQAILCLILLAGAALRSHACRTPVFQYAMQRWEPDYYRAYVFHEGPLDADQTNVVESLKALAEDEDRPLNLGVGAFDVAGKLDKETMAVYTNAAPKELPRVVLAYPYAAQIEAPPWQGPLSATTVKAVSKSTLCDKLQKKLIEGAATVWVFVDSKNTRESESAFTRLQEGLKEVTETVNEQVHDDEEPGPPVVTPDGQVIEVDPASFSYSVLRVSRDAVGENVLLASLLNSEPDLLELEEPMVFPVFGRGRALCAFVGRGINSTNILAACEFMGGPCSCQVKAMNPGFDLLVAASWDDYMDHMIGVADEAPPELTRVVGDGPDAGAVTSGLETAVLRPNAELETAVPRRSDAKADHDGLGLVGTVALVLAGLAALVAIGTTMFALRARRMEDQ